MPLLPASATCAGRRATLAAATVAALLSACSAAPTSFAVGSTLDGTGWILASLAGEAGGASPPRTLRFEADRVTGSDGCNRFSGRYALAGDRLALAGGGTAATRMACPPDVMRRADAFIGALGRVRTFRIADDQLTLLGVDGRVVATLARQPGAPAKPGATPTAPASRSGG